MKQVYFIIAMLCGLALGGQAREYALQKEVGKNCWKQRKRKEN